MIKFGQVLLIAGTLTLSGGVLAAEVPTVDLTRWRKELAAQSK